MSEQRDYVSEENAGFAAPALDLIAALALIALSVWVMIESVQMRAPDGIATAPGLLPFLTASTLALMCLVVCWQAIRRRHLGWWAGAEFSPQNLKGAALIAAIVFVYLLALQALAFQTTFTILGQRFTLGSFELVSPLVMTTLLAIFWRRPLVICFGLSVVYILMLAQSFRLLFGIPLWG